ncbi:MAG: alpha/beta fold hydrolase [Mycobacterium sp.]|nr:MAG: alpha/beta fold hydrolase [Mycobacterium sp.]
MLEVIDKGSRTGPPLLFVHGGWHGAWCWENFLNYFADAGYRAVAVSLRGHGASPAPKALRWCSMADYVEDVRTVADSLGGPPVLIGHSLGGFAVQRYLETRRAPAAVLVGSVPPKGFLRLAMRVWRRHPLIAMRAFTGGTLLEFVDTATLARDYLFCRQTPEDIVESCRSQAGPESLRAAALDPMIRRVRTGLVTTPMLVLGAEHDGFVSTAEVRATAQAYRTEPEFFSMGHNMMLEPGWPDVATRIHDWLQTRDQPI